MEIKNVHYGIESKNLYDILKSVHRKHSLQYWSSSAERQYIPIDYLCLSSESLYTCCALVG